MLKLRWLAACVCVVLESIVRTGGTNRDLVLEVLNLLPKFRHFTHGNSCQAQPPTKMKRKWDQVSEQTDFCEDMIKGRSK